MSVREDIYNNVSGGTSYVTVDFTNSILTADPANPSQIYYISFVPKGKNANNVILPTKAATGLSDLCLGGNVASASHSATYTNVAYTSITDLVADYMYDYINGHTANQFNTGVTLQLPLNF